MHPTPLDELVTAIMADVTATTGRAVRHGRQLRHASSAAVDFGAARRALAAVGAAMLADASPDAGLFFQAHEVSVGGRTFLEFAFGCDGYWLSSGERNELFAHRWWWRPATELAAAAALVATLVEEVRIRVLPEQGTAFVLRVAAVPQL